jgi:hypothetical protein
MSQKNNFLKETDFEYRRSNVRYNDKKKYFQNIMYSDWEEDWNERIIIISCDRAS